MIYRVIVSNGKNGYGGADQVEKHFISNYANTRVLTLYDHFFDSDDWITEIINFQNILNIDYTKDCIYLYFIVNGKYINPKVIQKIKDILNPLKTILYSGGNSLYTNSLNRAGNFNYINELFDIIIANSKFSYNRYISWGINKDKIIIVRGGANAKYLKTITRDEFDKKYNTKNNILLCVASRLVPWKGISDLIDHLNFKNEKLIIMGDFSSIKPEFRLQDKNFYWNLQNNSNIIYLGKVANNDVLNIMALSDIVIDIPANEIRHIKDTDFLWTETFGRSLCESLSVGTKIIGGNSGAIPEFFEENGYIGELVNSISEVNQAINKIITENKQIQVLKDYSWEAYFNEIDRWI